MVQCILIPKDPMICWTDKLYRLLSNGFISPNSAALMCPPKCYLLPAHQVVVGCAADLPSGVLQFSTNGVWIKPETFTGVQCVGT